MDQILTVDRRRHLNPPPPPPNWRPLEGQVWPRSDREQLYLGVFLKLHNCRPGMKTCLVLQGDRKRQACRKTGEGLGANSGDMRAERERGSGVDVAFGDVPMRNERRCTPMLGSTAGPCIGAC